jgi:hypothetical protein
MGGSASKPPATDAEKEQHEKNGEQLKNKGGDPLSPVKDDRWRPFGWIFTDCC